MVEIVTGGAGFIGSNLVDALLKAGKEVIALDNFVRGVPTNLDGARRSNGFAFEQVNCSDFMEFRAATVRALAGRRATTIWHMAANSDIPAGVADPMIDLRDTFMTTFSALLLMKELAIPDFHFASSSAIYGDFGDIEIHEDSGPCKPISNYGAMKLASEAQISASLESFGNKAVIFRFPNVVGTPATHGVIIDFINKLKLDPRRLPVLGNGTQQKPYLHVGDLVAAMLFIAEHAYEKVGIFNIGPQDAGVTVQFIAECVRDTVAPAAEIIYGGGNKGWVGDVPRFRYSTARLSELGWRPTMNSEMAVRMAVRAIAKASSI